MFSYIIRRILLLPITLIGITMVVFFVMAASPADPLKALLPKDGTISADERKREETIVRKIYGLDKSPPERYVRWLNAISPIGFESDQDSGEIIGSFGVKTPQLGNSLVYSRPVWDLMKEALPITILMNLITVPFMYFMSINLGIFSAKHKGGLPDVVIGTSTMALWATPVIFVAVMLKGYLANDKYLNWFPSGGLHDKLSNEMLYLPTWGENGFERGFLLDLAWHVVLPIICLSYASLAFLTKLTRSSMLENLSKDFIRTAKAKGVDSKTILYKHVLRNSILPLITAASSILPGLLAGSVLVETIFDIPGMGQLVVKAAQENDHPLVLAVTVISGVLGLFSYIVADVCYAIADPRVSYE